MILFVFWIFVAIALGVLGLPHEPNLVEARLTVQWLFAGTLALHALSVFAVVQYRRWRSSIAEPAAAPPIDEFMFIGLELWPYILLAAGAFFAGASLVGYPVLH